MQIRFCFLLILLAIAGCGPASSVAPDQHAESETASAESLQENPLATPAEIYGEFFERVQLESVYPDSKTFVDALPARAPAEILREYRQARAQPGFDLDAFVHARFDPAQPSSEVYRTIEGQDVRAHIDRLWSVLVRKPDDQRPWSSRLPLPERYIVPGGRFNEIYYWDSYFTMLGLEESGRKDLSDSMLRNFAHLIDAYGHIPNGNRTYFLSRSQPPFFAAMVELLASRRGNQVYLSYLPQLKREYAFWMDGAAQIAPGEAHRRVVRLDDGTLLNRYWDDRATPREESYREDVATARASGADASEVYRDLRAAAESGWDFSSRWLADGKTLASIRTTQLASPDLNSLLYQLERTIARGCELAGDGECAREMQKQASARRGAITRALWNTEVQAYTDVEWKTGRTTGHVTAATLYPLYFGVADVDHARKVAATVRKQLLQPHGLATTLVRTGQQWDAPNGWAPLQWIAVLGLRQYGEAQLARDIAQRWTAHNIEVFRATGKLVEKYDVSGASEGGGGEYPLQDGFGWTNGVLRKMLAEYPELAK